MSRLKKFTHSLFSGYLQIGVNVFYTLLSIPLALHYLSAKEFALWQVAVATAGYLLLIDFGISGASSRILIDHKDDRHSGAYGAVIKISIMVFSIQGLAIAIAGTAVSFWMPQLVNIHTQFPDPAEASSAARALIILTAGQCIIQGVFFPSRIFWGIVAAHQRYDIYNYSQAGVLVVQFVTLLLSFHAGYGIYSILIAAAAGPLFGFCCGWISTLWLHLFPRRGCWGTFDRKLFSEIFFFGGNMFLMAVGNQLIYASQVLIVSHTLGLTAAAVWAVAIKPFQFAQQLVGRIFDFSFSALSEMLVRGESERFIRRFRDVVMLSAAAAIFIFGCAALCNESFLQVWLKKPQMLQALRENWNVADNFLLALWFITAAVTRCNIGLTNITKQIGRMRYIYFFEGVTFVVAGILVAPRFGMEGIIIAAIVADVAWSGIYGTWRTSHYFGISSAKIIEHWLARPMMYLVFFALILMAGHFLTKTLPSPTVQLLVNAAISGAIGLVFLWLFALDHGSREEVKSILLRVKKRIPVFKV